MAHLRALARPPLSGSTPGFARVLCNMAGWDLHPRSSLLRKTHSELISPANHGVPENHGDAVPDEPEPHNKFNEAGRSGHATVSGSWCSPRKYTGSVPKEQNVTKKSHQWSQTWKGSISNPWQLNRASLSTSSNEQDSSWLPLAKEADEVQLEMLSGIDQGTVVMSLNRPKSRNAIGRIFLSQLLSHLHQLDAAVKHKSTPLPRVLILTSQVPGVFSAGADLKERRGMTSHEAGAFVDTLRDTFSLLEKLPMPTIAAIDGLALGGGLELALACDIRVCGSAAQLGLPETSLAIIPGAGGTQRLPRLVGQSVAKELIFTGRRVGAEEAKAIGLANLISEDGSSLEKATELARQMLTKGPIALQYAKFAIDRGLDLERDAGLRVERGSYIEILHTQDRIEGLKAFAEKRTPMYKGK